MTSFPAIFTLWNPRVHVSTSNSCDEPTDIETPVNKRLGSTTTLDVPYIDPNNCHVQFRRHFDNMQFECKSDIVKNLILLDDILNIIRSEAILGIAMREERNTYNLEIRF